MMPITKYVILNFVWKCYKHLTPGPFTMLQADVVAQTKIVYQEKELLQLIHEHLLAKGSESQFHETWLHICSVIYHRKGSDLS